MMTIPNRIGISRNTKGPNIISVEQWKNWAEFDRTMLSGPWKAPLPASYLAIPIEGSFTASQTQESLCELQHITVFNGKGLAAVEQVQNSYIPIFDGAGATDITIFEVVHGGGMPALLLMMNWPSRAIAAKSFLSVESQTREETHSSPVIYAHWRHFAEKCIVERHGEW